MPDAPQSPPRRFGLGRSLLFSSVLVAAFFGLLEGALRLVGVGPLPVTSRLIVRQRDTDITLPFMREDDQLFWSPQPGFRGEFMGKPVTINSRGLRGGEVAVPKPAGRRRLLCFGDSITFGYGVGDEETYAYFLGQRLAARGVEVVNAGITGYTSHQVKGLLARLAPALQADAATFLVGWNDQNKRAVTDRVAERQLHAVHPPPLGLDHLYLFRFLQGLYVRSLVREPVVRPVVQRVPLPDYLENMAAIVDLCRAAGIRPAWVALPRRRQAGEPVFSSPFAEAAAARARELGVPVLEVGDLGLHTTLPSNQDRFIDLIHLSPAGGQAMAAVLAPQIEAQGLLGRP